MSESFEFTIYIAFAAAKNKRECMNRREKTRQCFYRMNLFQIERVAERKKKHHTLTSYYEILTKRDLQIQFSGIYI